MPGFGRDRTHAPMGSQAEKNVLALGLHLEKLESRSLALCSCVQNCMQKHVHLREVALCAACAACCAVLDTEMEALLPRVGCLVVFSAAACACAAGSDQGPSSGEERGGRSLLLSRRPGRGRRPPPRGRPRRAQSR